MWQSSSPGFPYLLLSTQAPFPKKISCFISTCVSSDNSFPSVRHEPRFGPWKGSPFLQQYDYEYVSKRIPKHSEHPKYTETEGCGGKKAQLQNHPDWLPQERGCCQAQALAQNSVSLLHSSCRSSKIAQRLSRNEKDSESVNHGVPLHP